MSFRDAKIRLISPLSASNGLGLAASQDISAALTRLLADMFALYLKTKNFHWHMSGPHFRDYHLMLDEQSSQILAVTDVIAERARALGGTTLRSIGHIARIQQILDNDADYVGPKEMLTELCQDSLQLAVEMRGVHDICAEYSDIATMSLIENWLADAEGRTWFLHEALQDA